jgi:hypothetical protein
MDGGMYTAFKGPCRETLAVSSHLIHMQPILSCPSKDHILPAINDSRDSYSGKLSLCVRDTYMRKNPPSPYKRTLFPITPPSFPSPIYPSTQTIRPAFLSAKPTVPTIHSHPWNSATPTPSLPPPTPPTASPTASHCVATTTLLQKAAVRYAHRRIGTRVLRL